MGGCEVQPLPFNTGVEEFDLSLLVQEQGKGVHLELRFNVDLFESTAIEQMLTHYKLVLEWMTTDPGNGIYEFDLITDAERQQILIDWNNTTTDFPHGCIQDLITESDQEQPRKCGNRLQRKFADLWRP